MLTGCCECMFDLLLQVKVLTTSGGTFPIVTPVAISKTLPPAITAMQQQQQQENGKIYVLNALRLRSFAAPVLVFPLNHFQPKTSCKTVNSDCL